MNRPPPTPMPGPGRVINPETPAQRWVFHIFAAAIVLCLGWLLFAIRQAIYSESRATVYVNGKPTTLTCKGMPCLDATHVVSIKAGDEITVVLSRGVE